MKRTLVAVFVSLLLLSMTGCGGGGSSGGGGNGVVNPTPNPNPTPTPVPTPTPTPTPGPFRLISPATIQAGEYLSLKVVDEETGQVPSVSDALWIQKAPEEPAGRWTNPNPGPAITAWQAPQRIYEDTKFFLFVQIPSLEFEGYAEVNVLSRSITEAEVKEIVRLIACVKDSDGNYRLTRWIYKDVKVLVCPSAAQDIEAVRQGCKWWQDAGFGFIFDIQLTNKEYGDDTYEGRPLPPPGTVIVINKPEGNPDAYRWSQNIPTLGKYAYDTGTIRFPTGKQPETIWHELWHILIGNWEPIDFVPFKPRTKAAIQYILSHQPGDIV